MARLAANTPSPYRLIARMLLVAFAYFTLTRLALAIFAWPDAGLTASDVGRVFTMGALYDLAFYLYAAVPVALYLLLVPARWWQQPWHRRLVLLLITLTLCGLGFIAVAEWLFWDEFQVRFNFISVDYLVYRQEVSNNIAESYPLLPLLTAIAAQALVLTWALARWLYPTQTTGRPLLWRCGASAGWALAALLAMLFLDQSLRQGSSNNYVNELGSNGPYQFIAAFRNNELDYNQFYPTLPEGELGIDLRQQVAEPAAHFTDPSPLGIRRHIDNPGQERHLNVVLVMVESLGAEHVGYLGGKQGLTPYLDDLARDAMTFSNMYATGNRTVRGLEAVTLSIPPTPGSAIVKRIGRESGLWSLGNVLRAKGYDTRFLYGGRGYFDNMSAFFSGNGYAVTDQSSVADKEQGFANAWGMADEFLYSQALAAADVAAASGKPFFFHLMTTSNHRPYTYPDGRIDIPSGSGRDGAVKYSDWALHDFLVRARSHNWFGDTLFVVIADHTAGGAGKTALPVWRYHIPLLIYAPGLVKPQQVETLASQIDVAPTLLGLLNMDYDSSFFGKNVLAMAPEQGRALIANYQELGLLQGGELAVLRPQRPPEIQPQALPDSPPRLSSTADPLVAEAVSYYQGASAIYGQGLNRWPAESVLVGQP